jgi:hypothetical protein
MLYSSKYDYSIIPFMISFCKFSERLKNFFSSIEYTSDCVDELIIDSFALRLESKYSDFSSFFYLST